MRAGPKTIGIFSPSSAIRRENFERGLEVLHARGFRTVVHPQTFAGADVDDQCAGAVQDKIAAYRDLLENPEVDFIMASTGGNRACFMLPHLSALPLPAKPLMGYSDTTVLLAAGYKAGQETLFGPTVQTLGRMEDRWLDLTFDILSGKSAVTVPLDDVQVLQSGSVSAPVFAATLSLLLALVGTPWMPDLRGHILILEDIGEETSHLDRALWQLSTVLPFSGLAGLVFGDFIDMKDTGRPYGEDLPDILKKHLPEGLPSIIGAPVGHNNRIVPIRAGRVVTLDTGSSGLIFS